MTTTEKAREIVLFIRNMPDTEAIDYVRACLNVAHAEGINSGIEQCQQVIAQTFQPQVAA